MRLNFIVFFILLAPHIHAQYPYVKKLNYPDQLPTQVVYDMLTDKKGYIWVGTDKGLFRFNGRSFIPIPFDNTTSNSVSYLQEDSQGTIWCMNFYNQLFSLRADTLRRFVLDNDSARLSVSFNNVVVGDKRVWFHTFTGIYEFDKNTRHQVKQIRSPNAGDPILSSAYFHNHYVAYTASGKTYSSDNPVKETWKPTGPAYSDFRFVASDDCLTGLSIGRDRRASFEWKNDSLKLFAPINLLKDTYIFQAANTGRDEYWLCTQSGAYSWSRKTGEVRCYLPNARITDVVKDYQGNYWFSTLDNGIFVCSSLYNNLVQIYSDPLLDNFTKVSLLGEDELLTGNSQGLLAKMHIETGKTFRYKAPRSREIEFILYDSVSRMIISNRGTYHPSDPDPVELLDYSKGVARDIYGNLVLAVFNGAFVLNDHLGSRQRYPNIACPLYKARAADTLVYDGNKQFAVVLRQKRALTVLSSGKRQGFWVSYEDGLYEYRYDGKITEWLDEKGGHVIAKTLLQEEDGSLVAGTNKGVILFRNGKAEKHLHTNDGLSSDNIRKMVKADNGIWVLTDEGFDRINGWNGGITNYFEEYGLNSMVINDFVVAKGRIFFATTTGILVRYNLPRYYDYMIRFPFLKAMSNGVELVPGTKLDGGISDISFYFEAVHFLSSSSLVYQYRLIGLDTAWRTASSFVNQLSYNRLSPGKYVFEIRAQAPAAYQSALQRFAFEVPRPFWRQTIFFLLTLLFATGIVWISLRQWKRSLLKKQEIREELLKSQLVALRAQMNPHFLYNVLNTVQGLVYGNRKTEAGELLGNFSDLMRKTLQASDKQLLNLKDEIENIRLYLELEKARFEEGFSYEIITEQIEDLSSVYVPSLMLQPFVENAVKHGLLHKPGNKKVSIHFRKQDNGLHVTIDDNGIGRAQSMEINQRSKSKPFSFATEALSERMELFNRLYREKIQYRVIDKFDSRQAPSGTRIELFIPDYQDDAGLS